MLTFTDHNRHTTDFTYVYPVLSRRAEGLSIGINLNPNRACNWRCVYCQVPQLQRGSAPPIDLVLLEHELRTLLNDVLHGDFYTRMQLPSEWQVIRDIALSGNGEPTSAVELAEVAVLVGRVANDLNLPVSCRKILISNGSLVHLPRVQAGLRAWQAVGGELWFKLDSATDAGLQSINHAALSAAQARRNLQIAAGICPTWIQTCLFELDGQPPSNVEQQAYLAGLAELKAQSTPLLGVLLYSVARLSHQPEAARLSALPLAWLENFGAEIRQLGYHVMVKA